MAKYIFRVNVQEVYRPKPGHCFHGGQLNLESFNSVKLEGCLFLVIPNEGESRLASVKDGAVEFGFYESGIKQIYLVENNPELVKIEEDLDTIVERN